MSRGQNPIAHHEDLGMFTGGQHGGGVAPGDPPVDDMQAPVGGLASRAGFAAGGLASGRSQGLVSPSPPAVVGGRSLRPRGPGGAGARYKHPSSSAEEASDDGSTEGVRVSAHQRHLAQNHGGGGGGVRASPYDPTGEGGRRAKVAKGRGAAKARVSVGGVSAGTRVPPSRRGQQQQQRHSVEAGAPPGWSGGLPSGARVASTARGAAAAAAARTAASGVLEGVLPSRQEQ
ncbi:unnamed protein product, partial [Laminaria digitata]